mmetsp:Transcript_15832/g.60294  ORF Transcript_15832/g.60294 Transcript_15832/m.60294 type:complete len:168 (-) Transcript_15832:398-901(-)
MNPTASPTTSALLNGEWELLYSSGVGLPALLAKAVASLPSFAQDSVDLDNIDLTIKRSQPRVKAMASARIGRVDFSLEVDYRIEAESGMRLRESYDGGEVSALNLSVRLPNVRSRRQVFITYLDDDLLISRDALGGFDLLRRRDKEFMSQTALAVPSNEEGDDSPGA